MGSFFRISIVNFTNGGARYGGAVSWLKVEVVLGSRWRRRWLEASGGVVGYDGVCGDGQYWFRVVIG